jgi:hypothetical protein
MFYDKNSTFKQQQFFRHKDSDKKTPQRHRVKENSIHFYVFIKGKNSYLRSFFLIFLAALNDTLK